MLRGTAQRADSLPDDTLRLSDCPGRRCNRRSHGLCRSDVSAGDLLCAGSDNPACGGGLIRRRQDGRQSPRGEEPGRGLLSAGRRSLRYRHPLNAASAGAVGRVCGSDQVRNPRGRRSLRHAAARRFHAGGHHRNLRPHESGYRRGRRA